MLEKLTIEGVQLPRLYIASNKEDVKFAMEHGMPFIRWKLGKDELIKMLLRPTLESMFPHINWDRVLGEKVQFKTVVEMSTVRKIDAGNGNDEWMLSGSEYDDPLFAEGEVVDKDGTLIERASITTDTREFSGGSTMRPTKKKPLSTYIGDMSSSVNLEVLQRLHLMPAFIGDIMDCIKTNIESGMYWREGYNKRRALPVGRYDASMQLPNLIILDVSGSIPRGISATMISLIDTLRTQLHADLIITSSNSRFYPAGSKLPDPQTIRDAFGYGNESNDFWHILRNNIKGKHYGHVISFGDWDAPEDYVPYYSKDREQPFLEGTTVDMVHHYHTSRSTVTGYAKWCYSLAKKPIEKFDTSWCNFIK